MLQSCTLLQFSIIYYYHIIYALFIKHLIDIIIAAAITMFYFLSKKIEHSILNDIINLFSFPFIILYRYPNHFTSNLKCEKDDIF